MSRRAIAVVLVAVVLLTALVVSSRLNPVYQSRALVSVGPMADKGSNSLEQNLTVARGSAVRLAAQASLNSAGGVHVGIVEGSLEFRVRSRDPAEVAEVANAYAQAYVEVRRKQLMDERAKGEGPEWDRLRDHLSAAPPPSVMTAAHPARSPLSPWPSEPWAVAGLALIALALVVPNRECGE